MWLDATAQAELVRSKEVSARELAEAAIARIEAVDGEINAVIHRRFDEALAEAGSGKGTIGPRVTPGSVRATGAPASRSSAEPIRPSSVSFP